MLNFSDLRVESAKESLCHILERVISTDDPLIENIPYVLERFQNVNEQQSMTKDFVTGFIAGYISFKAKNMTKCFSCIQSLQNPDKTGGEGGRYKLINALNRGGLHYPSNELYSLINSIEEQILSIVECDQLNSDTFFDILDALRSIEISKVGCDDHKHEFTISIMSFYLIMRSHFIAKRYNSYNDMNKKNSKKFRKSAKL